MLPKPGLLALPISIGINIDVTPIETVICMPWYNGTYPPSYKNQPLRLRTKAVEIANEMLEKGAEEGIAIATGLKRAREFFSKKGKSKKAKK